MLKYLLLLPAMLLLLIGVALAKVPTVVKPCHCLKVDRNIEVTAEPAGKIVDQLTDGATIKLGAITNTRIEIHYSKDRSLTDCRAINKFEQHGWINTQDLPVFALLAKNFNPQMADGQPLLTIKNKRDEHDQWSAEFRYHGRLLLQADLTGFDEQFDREYFNYWVLYTGRADYPYLLFYSGFASDMYGDNSAMIFFGDKGIKRWLPNFGNRTSTQLLKIEKDHLIIHEAYFCSLPIQTKLKINDNGDVSRIAGFFYPQSLSGEWDFQLQTEIKLFKQPHKNKTISIKPGKITLKLISIAYTKGQLPIDELVPDGYYFKKGLVRVKINDRQGYIDFKTLSKNVPILYQLACCGCG